MTNFETDARDIPRLTAMAHWTLVVVTGFNALSALAGGIWLLIPGELSMPAYLLEGSIFSSYLVPALILGGIVGGTQTAAFVLQLRRRPSRHLWSAIAGFGMVIWIVAEMALLGFVVALQIIYLTTGLLQLILVFALLGVVSWLPRAPEAEPRRL